MGNFIQSDLKEFYDMALFGVRFARILGGRLFNLFRNMLGFLIRGAWEELALIILLGVRVGDEGGIEVELIWYLGWNILIWYNEK